MSVKRVTACAGLLLLAACVSRVEVQRFDLMPAEIALQPGRSAIKGSALMRKKTGVIVLAAGEIVWLIPAAPSSEKRLAKLFPRGGAIYDKVEVKGQDQVVEVIVSGN
ncbi:MAG: hypothetical protein NTZ14_13400 [Hyphomicrobiales bacterium]|nr:hypothetical protein [Hyphomicrobiales bacterium]